jgi:hypothetical protein
MLEGFRGSAVCGSYEWRSVAYRWMTDESTSAGLSVSRTFGVCDPLAFSVRQAKDRGI